MVALGPLSFLCFWSLTSMGKHKIGSHYDIPDDSNEDEETQPDVPRHVHPGNITHFLRETTRVSNDGRTHHNARLIPIPASPTHRASDTLLMPDVASVEVDAGPIFEQEGGLDSDSEYQGGWSLCESDDPLRQWVENCREEFLEILLLLEGRADHRSYSVCASCSVGKADHRCRHCMSSGELVCQSCLLSQHERHPLHRVEYWNGVYFEKKTLKDLGLRIQLGHWRGRRTCLVPEHAAGDEFVIVDEHGIHMVCLDFCGCGTGGSEAIQLMRAGLYPATVIHPCTAASFNVLDHYQLLSFESKCSTYEFYHSLARATDNTGLNPPPMLKRAGRGLDPTGVNGTAPGECALLCPACPHPGKNLPPDWQDAPEEKRFLYALFLAMDANFRLKRKDVSTEEKDPGLGDGWSFYSEVMKYMGHVKEHWNTTQERSTCVSHDAVDKPDREARGTASSGIGAVDCARHNMKRPLGVGDLQFGERYLNMDYMFFRSLVGTELLRFYVSYDIACQWHINIWNRMDTYEQEIRMVKDEKFIVFLVPKFHLPAHIEVCNLLFSFNLTRDVGQTDGEAPECGWANANPLAGSTKEMGPGARRDTLNDHFNDWNWKKTIAFARLMLKKTRTAVPEMVATKVALDDMEQSLRGAGVEGEVEAVEVWTKMLKVWEKNDEKPNPFETLKKDDHLAQVRLNLAEEAAKRLQVGEEEEGDVEDEMHVTEMLAMGLQLEEHQRTLGFDMAGMGLHPTDDQRRTMVERTSKLRRKIDSWAKQQQHFIPRVVWLRKREDAVRARSAASQPVPGVKVQDIRLWLPSAIMKLAGAKRRPHCTKEVQEFEYRLRVGQANEALHEIRQQLLVRTHMYKYKDKNIRGGRSNMRSKHKIDAVDDRIRRAATQYRAARGALVSLGKVLDEHGWKVTLKELKDDDIRARPRSSFADPERQRGVRGRGAKRVRLGKKRVVRPLSWIWVSQTKAQDGVAQEMNEALRIEWARAHARRWRWSEEVDLLEEEMRRILQFLTWRADWWMTRIDLRGLPDGAQREGETAYAARQAALQRDLHKSFTFKWKGLAELIRGGRAGEDLGNTDDEWEDLEDNEDDSDSELEEEPIPATASRPVLTTYVDI
ncbi:hypothetical protein B0H10DRAFT_2068058 [Mycena sp. CBHHK59/15]|nr:hypothetical protein B0H10DRAFT_2068058 [Mycena sp. CBHHK59/15]